MVRLEAQHIYLIRQPEIHFNSFMVRLEVQYLRENLFSVQYFNSFMVRLEASVRVTTYNKTHISIPLWYD